MKKIIALTSICALFVMVLGPALTAGTVSTGLIKGSGGGSAPTVKVKWEMLDLEDGAPGVGEAGLDDDLITSGAQFMPPGVWDDTLNYTVCAIATDPDNIADIAGVYAEIFYPEGRAYSEDPAKPDGLGDPDTEYPGVGACGIMIEQNELIELTKLEGYELFCNQVRTNNNNLPKFYGSYNYDEICAADGELMEGTAFVYCDDKTLKWEDPAGSYEVVAYAQDVGGKFSPYLENYFEYLALTGFEKDFDNVNYGEIISLSIPKKIHGDKTFGYRPDWCENPANNTQAICEGYGCYWYDESCHAGDGKPTVRNIGNTRLNMKIAQDDMGFGLRDVTNWNVEFDARVGTDEADWEIYDPFDFKGSGDPTSGEYRELEDIVELSEVEKMDFSVHVEKWLEPTSYTGTMWLSADVAEFRTCVGY